MNPAPDQACLDLFNTFCAICEQDPAATHKHVATVCQTWANVFSEITRDEQDSDETIDRLKDISAQAAGAVLHSLARGAQLSAIQAFEDPDKDPALN